MLPASGWLPRSQGAPPTSFPLPVPYVVRFRTGAAAGEIVGARVPAPARGVVHGDAQVASAAGITGEGDATSYGELRFPSTFACGVLDALRLERAGSPCDLELIIYDLDDETELFVAGSSIWHAFPHLVQVSSYGEAEVDFRRGKAVIGQINVSVLDKRLQPGDWRTGRLTAVRTDGGGRPILNGRRALLRRMVGGRWTTLIDGVVQSSKMDESFVAFDLVIRDFREVERKTRAFTTSTTCSVFPKGTTVSWGRLPDGGFLSPAATPWAGRWFQDAAGRGHFLLEIGRDEFPLDALLTDRMAAAAQAVWSEPLQRLAIPHLVLRWRRRGSADPWAEWRNIGVLDLELWGGAMRIRMGLWQTREQTYRGQESRKVERLRVVLPEADAVWPSDGQWYEFSVAYEGPPTEDWPLHWEGTAGGLLRELYDGGLGSSSRFRQRYDLAAMDAITTPVSLRLTAPVADLREWTEKHLWQLLGGAPVWADSGEVLPVFSRLPADVDALPVIDDTVLVPEAGWEESGSRTVNVVRVTYRRVSRVRLVDDPTQATVAGDLLWARDVVAEYVAEDSLADVEESAVEMATDAFCSPGADGEPVDGLLEAEVGWQLARARRDELWARYRYGAETVTGTCHRSRTAALRVGDWVRQRASWNPNALTRRRGADGIAQVVAIKDESCGWRTLQMEQLTAQVVGGAIVLPPPRGP